MASASPRPAPAPDSRIVIKVVLYYVVVFALGWVFRDSLPATTLYAEAPLGSSNASAARLPLVSGTDQFGIAATAAFAMLAACVLALPVAWVYLLTRAKRGYQQSVVQLLIILPLVIAGIVVLVKNSLALAFSLAGIVAAVRFRNTLEDSKDAVYVFLATALGLAAGVNVPVAGVMSLLFNMIVIVLWTTDFGHSPVALEGKQAERRLKRAREMAQTGTFVARMDDEVFKNMTREQLEGVAQRAWKRANQDGGDEKGREMRLRIVTTNPAGVRPIIEPLVGMHARRCEIAGQNPTAGGSFNLDYLVVLKKNTDPENLVALVRSSGAEGITDVELQ